MKCRLITICEDHAPVFSDFDSVSLAEAAARPLHDAGHKVCAINLSCGTMVDFSKRFRQRDEWAEEVERRRQEAAYERHVDSLAEEQIIRMGADYEHRLQRHETHGGSRYSLPKPLHHSIQRRLNAIRKRQDEEREWTGAMEQFLSCLSPDATNVLGDSAPAPARVLQAPDADIAFRLFLIWAGGMALICLGIAVLA